MAEGIGNRIRTARDALGLKQSELARRIGVRRQVIHAIEVGARKPTLEQLENLCVALNVTSDFLLDLRTVLKESIEKGTDLEDAALGLGVG